MMNIKKLKEIYEQAEEKTRQYHKFMEDAVGRSWGFGVLGFYNHSTGFEMQLAMGEYDQLDKAKMENFEGGLSESGYVHIAFDYEDMKVTVCFSPEDVKK